MIEVEHKETFLSNEIIVWLFENGINFEVDYEPYKYLPPGSNVGYTEHRVKLLLRFFSESDATLFKVTWG